VQEDRTTVTTGEAPSAAAWGTAAWLTAANAALDDLQVESALALTVGHALTDTGLEWHLRIDGGRCRVGAGLGEAAVVLRCDSTTAAALRAGEQVIPSAVLAGRLAVDGDVRVLADATDALNTAAARLAQLDRAGT
jgi:hypothetical protein